MYFQYKVSESNTTRSRCYFFLVTSADGTVAAINENGGQPQIIVNGASPVNTINQLVVVDQVNAPGLYYVSLDKSELAMMGFITLRYKSGNTKEFQIMAQVIADDPYVSHTGPGLSLPSGLGKGLESGMPLGKKDMEELAKMVWDYILNKKEKISAGQVLLSRSDFDETKDIVKTNPDPAFMAKLDEFGMKLSELEMPDIIDYTQSISMLATGILAIQNQVSSLPSVDNNNKIRDDVVLAIGKVGTEANRLLANMTDLSKLNNMITDFQGNLEDVNTTMEVLKDAVTTAQSIEQQLTNIASSIEEISGTVDQRINVASAVDDLKDNEVLKQVAEMKMILNRALRSLSIKLVDAKYSIIGKNK